MTLLLMLSFSATSWAQGVALDRTDWTAASSSYHPDGRSATIDKILDGQSGTYWHSNYGGGTGEQNMPQWFVVTLPESETISGFGLQRRQGNGNGPKTYKVYVSDTDFGLTAPATTQEQRDAVNNIAADLLAGEGTIAANNNDMQNVTFATPKTGKYVLFVTTETFAGGTNAQYTCVAEFNLYSPASVLLPKQVSKLQTLLDVAPIGTTFGHYSSESVTAAQAALDAANGVLSNADATEAEFESALTAATSAYETFESSRVGYGELYILKCTGNGKMAIYNESCVAGENDPTIVLSNWTDYDRRSFFKLDVAQIVEGTPYYTIRPAVDDSKYVFAINKNNANSNVGVKTVTDGTVVDDMLWKFVANGSGWNIIPKDGSNGWNCRGSYGGNAHIGQWNNNSSADNIWKVESTEEFLIAEKVTPYEALEGMIGCIDVQRTLEALKTPAENLRSDFTEANLTAYKNFVFVCLPPPSGLYKIRNKALDKYLFSESSGNAKNITFVNDGGDNAKYYWNVSFDGNIATIIGSTGLSMAKGAGTNAYSSASTDYISPLTLQPAPDGSVAWTENFFLFPNVHSTAQNNFTKGNAAYNTESNPYFLTTWSTTSAANQYTFEPVTLPVGAEIYTVDIKEDGASVTYNGADYEGNATVYDGGFYVFNSEPLASDFTASAVSGRMPVITISNNRIFVAYLVGDDAKVYNHGTRASELKTDGTKYLIYNATQNDNRYGLYYNSGSNTIQKNRVHPAAVETARDSRYLFTLEAVMNDGVAVPNKYYLKSVSGNTYFSINGRIDNASGQALNIIEYSTSTHKAGTANFTGDNGGTTVAAGSIASDQKFWSVELDDVNTSSHTGCWNGNPDAYAQWESSHALAFYEVVEVEAETALADKVELLDETLSKSGPGYPVQAERETLLDAIVTANTVNTLNLGNEYTTAINTYKNSTNVVFPEDGQAFVLMNVISDTNQRALKYTANDWGCEYQPCTYENIQDVSLDFVFICHKMDDGQYAFVNNAGKFVAVKLSTSSVAEGVNGNKGYTDSYDDAVSHHDIMKGNRFGCLAIKGHSTSRNLFYVRHDGSDVFDQTENQIAASNEWYSSDFRFIQYPYENTPALREAKGVEGVTGVSTFSAPFATVIPEGVTAYYGKAQGAGYISLEQITTPAIPANQGVILTGAVGKVTMVPATTEEVVAIESNELANTAGAAKDVAAGSLILTNKIPTGETSQVTAFYALTNPGKLGMNKAYIASAAGSALRFMFGGDLTGIESVENGAWAADDAPLYDLSGRKVSAPVKGGIYVKNGKKIIF